MQHLRKERLDAVSGSGSGERGCEKSRELQVSTVDSRVKPAVKYISHTTQPAAPLDHENNSETCVNKDEQEKRAVNKEIVRY